MAVILWPISCRSPLTTGCFATLPSSRDRRRLFQSIVSRPSSQANHPVLNGSEIPKALCSVGEVVMRAGRRQVYSTGSFGTRQIQSAARGLCVWLTSAGVLFVSAVTAWGQSETPAPIVQPGAPGQSSKILSPETAVIPLRTPAMADVHFMQGMIMHHSQAVQMTELLRSPSRKSDLPLFGTPLSSSQADQMKYIH